MSIWSSFFTLGKIRNGNYPTYSADEWSINDEPYSDFTAADGMYTTPDTLGSTPRGGFVDLAESWTELPLIRLSVTEIDNGQEREAEVYLSDEQAARLTHDLMDVLRRRVYTRAGGEVSKLDPGIMRSLYDREPFGLAVPPAVDEDDGPPISYQSESELDEVRGDDQP